SVHPTSTGVNDADVDWRDERLDEARIACRTERAAAWGRRPARLGLEGQGGGAAGGRPRQPGRARPARRNAAPAAPRDLDRRRPRLPRQGRGVRRVVGGGGGDTPRVGCREDGMNAVETAEFRELLEAERDRVISALATMREAGQRTMDEEVGVPGGV